MSEIKAPTNSTENRLTKWEAGNVLVKLADDMSEAIGDLSKGKHHELAEYVEEMRKILALKYEQDGFVDEMGFGI